MYGHGDTTQCPHVRLLSMSRVWVSGLDHWVIVGSEAQPGFLTASVMASGEIRYYSRRTLRFPFVVNVRYPDEERVEFISEQIDFADSLRRNALIADHWLLLSLDST